MGPKSRPIATQFGISVLALSLSLVALTVAIWHLHTATTASLPTSSSSTVPGLLERIGRTGELHAAYGVYPPYTMEDPNTKAVSGFSVEVINHIASELNCRVVWHRMNWNTMSADLKRGEYDVIADPIFQTIPRAREFAFSAPYAYFSDGIVVVGKNDNRFAKFDDLDVPNIRISVGLGWASETLVKSRFTKATILPVQTSTDLLQVFNGVLSGRADAAVADGADAARFAREHPSEVKVLFLNNPPAYFPAGFALRLDDRQGADFLSESIRTLASTGTLGDLAKRYGIPSDQVESGHRSE